MISWLLCIFAENRIMLARIFGTTGRSYQLPEVAVTVKGTNLARASSMTFRPARTGHGAHQTKDGIDSTFLK